MGPYCRIKSRVMYTLLLESVLGLLAIHLRLNDVFIVVMPTVCSGSNHSCGIHGTPTNLFSTSVVSSRSCRCIYRVLSVNAYPNRIVSIEPFPLDKFETCFPHFDRPEPCSPSGLHVLSTMESLCERSSRFLRCDPPSHA